MHWLCHTTPTFVERAFGEAVARAAGGDVVDDAGGVDDQQRLVGFGASGTRSRMRNPAA